MVTKRQLHRLVDLLPEHELAAAARALEAMSGRAAAPEPEDRAWLDAPLAATTAEDAYEWGSGGPPPARPVRFDPDRGIVIDDGPR